MRWSLTLPTSPLAPSAGGTSVLARYLRSEHADFNPAAPGQGSKVLKLGSAGFATESWGWR